MPINYEVFENQRLVVFTHKGSISDEAFFEFYQTFYQQKNDCSTFHVLVDLCDTVSCIRSPESLKTLAGYFGSHPELVYIYRKVAVIAPTDISFDLARMFESSVSFSAWEFKVFKTKASAMKFLTTEDDNE